MRGDRHIPRREKQTCWWTASRDERKDFFSLFSLYPKLHFSSPTVHVAIFELFWTCTCVRLYSPRCCWTLWVHASVRLQRLLSNCLSIIGSALWSGGCAGPQHSLRRVVSHHARLITETASLLAVWQARPSAMMLHASDNFISPIRPSKSPLLSPALTANRKLVLRGVYARLPVFMASNMTTHTKKNKNKNACRQPHLVKR